jgi:hypothetical protein
LVVLVKIMTASFSGGPWHIPGFREEKQLGKIGGRTVVREEFARDPRGDRLMASVPAKFPPAPTPPETALERFRRLATAWHRETDYLSSMAESDRHPAYQEIIRLGPEVVPLLLRDLEDNHTHWFGALSAITGANPVPESAGGNIPKMAEAWLRWPKDHGYQW